ncbi:hypothetical protein APY94_00975 [Thermococcus celericrescens]|uniref:TRAM domain-containing protein n=2 Tax=Thermococcus celericrescens TaxID=227598 RepID=A0A100XZU2_9EURY|nr:hypothetical protein APY94_00975 [Thermococcus celericrescens]
MATPKHAYPGRDKSDQQRRLGVLEANGKTAYVPFAYPGDVVNVVPAKRRFGRRIVTDFELLESSPLRQTPRCPYFGKCGGCLWQGMKYRDQLKLTHRGRG